MDKEIISIIKEQNKLLFENIYEQIKTATLEKRIDNVNNSRFLFHMIHSIDRYFINPFEYDYSPVEDLIQINENYSIISESREGYIEDDGYVISRNDLMIYMDYVKNKITDYLDSIDDNDLYKKPDNCPYTRMELILAQYRHSMFHCGMSEIATYDETGEWSKYTGLPYISK